MLDRKRSERGQFIFRIYVAFEFAPVLWKRLIYSHWITVKILCTPRNICHFWLEYMQSRKRYNWGLKLSLEFISPPHRSPLSSPFVLVSDPFKMNLFSGQVWKSRWGKRYKHKNISPSHKFCISRMQLWNSFISFPTVQIVVLHRKLLLQPYTI